MSMIQGERGRPRLIPAAVAARDWLLVSRRTLGRLIATGRLRPYRSTPTRNGRLFFAEEDLLAFLESMRVGGID